MKNKNKTSPTSHIFQKQVDDKQVIYFLHSLTNSCTNCTMKTGHSQSTFIQCRTPRHNHEEEITNEFGIASHHAEMQNTKKTHPGSQNYSAPMKLINKENCFNENFSTQELRSYGI